VEDKARLQFPLPLLRVEMVVRVAVQQHQLMGPAVDLQVAVHLLLHPQYRVIAVVLLIQRTLVNTLVLAVVVLRVQAEMQVVPLAVQVVLESYLALQVHLYDVLAVAVAEPTESVELVGRVVVATERTLEHQHRTEQQTQVVVVAQFIPLVA
jgi:hypothetical protein